jgi:hypothetical protein
MGSIAVPRAMLHRFADHVTSVLDTRSPSERAA